MASTNTNRDDNSHPNLMVIMTDQQRADFFRSEGFGVDTMPFLDSLRPRGTWFPKAYTTMPVCIPARVSMLTGRYTCAHGVIANWPDPAPRYGQDLISVLREQNYELALFGKNHSHATPDRFDVWCEYSHTEGAPRSGREAHDHEFDEWMTNLAAWVSTVPTPFPLDDQYPVRIVSDTLSWLDKKHDRAWFALVDLPEPHSPVQAPEPYFSLFPIEDMPPPVAGLEALTRKNHQWRYQYHAIKHYHPECDTIAARYRSVYCGMLRLIDDQVRRLVAALETQHLLDNTIVLYLSDHGEFCGDYGLFRKGLALPECCNRIPMFWYGRPVQAYAGRHPAFVSIADVFPTMCEAIGAEIPPGVQGRSLWPLLQGQTYPEQEFASAFTEHGVGGRVLSEAEALPFGDPAETIYINGVARTNFDGTRIAMSGFRRAVVKGEWKLIYDLELPLEMYHLASDPHELNNLAADESLVQVRQELFQELLKWSMRLDDNLGVRRYAPAMPEHNWYWTSPA
jgi:arylsulfatase A-like enzyme